MKLRRKASLPRHGDRIRVTEETLSSVYGEYGTVIQVWSDGAIRASLPDSIDPATLFRHEYVVVA